MATQGPRRSKRLAKKSKAKGKERKESTPTPSDNAISQQPGSPAPSQGYLPEPEHEYDESQATPRKRKQRIGSSTAKRQIKRARNADPHKGRCLITNRGRPIEMCRLVAKATNPGIITKLEYAWGMNGELNLDTRYNMVFLRSDWHQMFDAPAPLWMLIPEMKDLEELRKLTVGHSRDTAELERLQNSQTRYQYHILPTQSMKEPICHFSNPNDTTNHTTYPVPYEQRSPLQSHVRPQFVVINSALKLQKLGPLSLPLTLATILSIDEKSATGYLYLIEGLYKEWMAMSNNQEENGSEDDSEGDGGTRSIQDDDLAMDLDSGGEEDNGGDNSGGSGGARDLDSDIQEEEPEECFGSGDISEEDEDTLITGISDWLKGCKAASEHGWEPIVQGDLDGQIRAYTKERARAAPPPGAWADWKPYWRPRGIFSSAKYLARSRLSSNDWAARERDVFLPRRGGRCR